MDFADKGYDMRKRSLLGIGRYVDAQVSDPHRVLKAGRGAKFFKHFSNRSGAVSFFAINPFRFLNQSLSALNKWLCHKQTLLTLMSFPAHSAPKLLSKCLAQRTLAVFGGLTWRTGCKTQTIFKFKPTSQKAQIRFCAKQCGLLARFT